MKKNGDRLDPKTEARIAGLDPARRALLRARARELGIDDLLKLAGQDAGTSRPADGRGGPTFSLFFFSDNGSALGHAKYDLLMQSAQFADRHEFVAVWTPERHFHPFGGLYPNPALLGAAIATATSRIGIRAGSVVLPLHHPARVVEEWFVVDNLSGGRVGVAFATGWRPEDFVLAGSAHADRREAFDEALAVVLGLWRGDAMPFETVDGNLHHLRTYPRPLQSELPTWLTVGSDPEGWRRAGRIGTNVLAMLGRQRVAALGERIAMYEQSLAANGHDRSERKVTIMLHAFLGADEVRVREIARAPMQRYLATYLSQSAGSDPGARPRSDDTGRDALCAAAVDWYFEGSGLFGTPDRCHRLVHDLSRSGVDEIACLIDFGIDPDTVLGSLPYLNELRQDVVRRTNAQHRQA
jgi:natural product biosynthesis luciferase-like monooxygenase protein